MMKDKLLPLGQALMDAQGHREWWFQQDNDPTHRGAQGVIAEYNKDTKSCCRLLLNWPPHSPDLSPIENIWAVVQAQVNAKGYKTFDQFQKGVLLALKSVPTSCLEAMYAGMRGRLEATIAGGGKKLKH